ncbi:CYTH domain-containing protein [Planomonospora sp. ID91781]|uniref:class IV adenylate cyclase n=1 Tax=Planomonospora sp. ID91781 TaxID=2738135 RepID=UPI0018C3807A|nr:CYTH domain-containing protein [Planomonospora sp. ID91781]MBG0823260.1 CYTH domain-containing protein [Planomonospora sp. ID91781]
MPFSPRSGTFAALSGQNVGVAFARLRTQDGRHLFTVKTPLANEMACDEHETWVADREQMHRAVIAMGLRPTVRIVKTRRTGALGGMTVCVDDVEHADCFFEIERTVTGGQPGRAVQEELDAFARSPGVDLERTTDTYDSLVRPRWPPPRTRWPPPRTGRSRPSRSGPLLMSARVKGELTRLRAGWVRHRSDPSAEEADRLIASLAWPGLPALRFPPRCTDTFEHPDPRTGSVVDRYMCTSE